MKKIAKKLWLILALLLMAVLAMELGVKSHTNFGIDGERFFYAGYGFVSCAAIIIFSWLLGFLLKRKEDYYNQRGNE